MHFYIKKPGICTDTRPTKKHQANTQNKKASRGEAFFMFASFID